VGKKRIFSFISLIKKNIVEILFFLVGIVFFIPIVVLTLKDLRPPHWDMARHLWNSAFYYDYLRGFLKNGIFNGHTDLVRFLSDYRYYPPFLYYVTIPFYVIFGLSVKAALISNVFWVFLLGIGFYFGSKKYFNNTLVGLLAFSFFLFCPFTLGQSMEYQIDFPLSAVFIAFLATIPFTEKLQNLGVSFLLGFLFGLGMITKWTFVLLSFAPLVLFFSDSLIEIARSKDKTQAMNFVRNFFAFVLASIFAMWSWYFSNYPIIKIDLTKNGVDQARLEGDPYGLNVESFTIYLWYLVRYQLYLPFFIFLLLGIFLLIKNKKVSTPLSLFLIFISIYIIFSYLPNKDARYTYPYVSILGLIFACGICELKRKKIRNIAIILFYFISFLNLLFSRVPILKRGEDLSLDIGKKSYKKIVLASSTSYTYHPGNLKNSFLFDDIFGVLENLESQNDASESLKVSVFSCDNRYFNFWNFTQEARFRHLKIDFSFNPENINRADAVILVLGGNSDLESKVVGLVGKKDKNLEEIFSKSFDSYDCTREESDFDCLSGKTVTIYKL